MPLRAGLAINPVAARLTLRLRGLRSASATTRKPLVTPRCICARPEAFIEPVRGGRQGDETACKRAERGVHREQAGFTRWLCPHPGLFFPHFLPLLP